MAAKIQPSSLAYWTEGKLRSKIRIYSSEASFYDDVNANTLSSSNGLVVDGEVVFSNSVKISGSMAIAGTTLDTDFGIVLPNNSTTGRIKAASLVTYSSRDLKTNIQDIQNPVDKIMNLRGVSYNWKDSGISDIGLIAEEVKNIVPEVVHASKDYLTLDYSRLVSVLVEAMKVQQKQIITLEKKVEKLENSS